jgi:hypothetical protein
MKVEQNRAGEFLISEANGTRSRETVTILEGFDIKTGTLLGKVTANDKYIPYLAGAADGSETAAAILYRDIDTSATGLNADSEQLVIEIDAEVSLEKLYGHDAAGEVDLNAIGIKVR